MLLQVVDSLSQEIGADSPWPAEFTVRDGHAVRTLLHLKAVRMLGPFLHGPHTLSQAAAELEAPTSTTAYWIRKLESVGLLVRLEPERRGGMPMPRYRSAGRVLFLPFASVPPGLDSDLLDGGRRKILDRFLDGVDAVLAEAGHTGLQFTASGPVGVEVDVREGLGSTRTPPWTDFWGTFTLTRAQATDLAAELRELVARYRNLERPTGTGEYLVHAGMVPAPRRRRRSAG